MYVPISYSSAECAFLDSFSFLKLCLPSFICIYECSRNAELLNNFLKTCSSRFFSNKEIGNINVTPARLQNSVIIMLRSSQQLIIAKGTMLTFQ